jgi:lipopolysaccharide transport system permease protein
MLTEYSPKETVISAEDKQMSVEPSGNNADNLFENKDSIIIEPKHFISSLDLKSLWEYRELFYFLALRDIKIRYKQTLLGIAWVVLQPVITTLIFTTIFLRLAPSQELVVPYPLLAFSGFTLWTFINAAILNSSNSLINHSALITKVYFPRLVIPISAVGATLVDLSLGLGSLLVAMLIYKVPLTWGILWIPVLLIPALLLSLGFGIIMAALNVRYRDVKYILPFVLQLLLFSSPIFYSLSMLSKETIWMWQFNPLTGILENFRALLFGQNLDWYSLSVSIIVSVAVFFLAVYVFHKMEDDFADVI